MEKRRHASVNQKACAGRSSSVTTSTAAMVLFQACFMINAQRRIYLCSCLIMQASTVLLVAHSHVTSSMAVEAIATGLLQAHPDCQAAILKLKVGRCGPPEAPPIPCPLPMRPAGQGLHRSVQRQMQPDPP